ncbi:MAG: hypothetical protein J3Q66DRAFT_365966 [Benniella sp.]|nr:MAG: hypothetical protein J3Q66DRAFT_365966 [Benniella sp.]
MNLFSFLRKMKEKTNQPARPAQPTQPVQPAQPTQLSQLVQLAQSSTVTKVDKKKIAGLVELFKNRTRAQDPDTENKGDGTSTALLHIAVVSNCEMLDVWSGLSPVREGATERFQEYSHKHLYCDIERRAYFDKLKVIHIAYFIPIVAPLVDALEPSQQRRFLSPIKYQEVKLKPWNEHALKIANFSQLLQLIPVDLVTRRMQVIPLARFFCLSV